jgi:secreted trypsin-like serine protease
MVVGGDPSSISKSPWQVAVVNSESHLCSGSLITPTVVLTAAHCVAGSTPADIEVFAGLTDLTERTPQDARLVSAIAMHPDFVPAPEYRNDVALLTLSLPVPAATGALTIALPVSRDPSSWPAIGTSMTISGWGVTEPDSTESSATLNAGRVAVLSGPGERCGQYGDTFDPATTICAGLPDGSVDTCQGDSGGPLVATEAGLPVLAGSVVGGSACASATLPGLYSRLTAYLPWIRSNGIDIEAAAAAAGKPLPRPGATPAVPPTAHVGTRISAATAARWVGLPTPRVTIRARRNRACRQDGTRVLLTRVGTCTIVVTRGRTTRIVPITVIR